MKFNIITLGCKVNTYESEFMKASLLSHGYLYSEDIGECDVIIVNTCSVTNQADNKSAKLIRQARRNNPNAILLVCGCSSQYKKEAYLDLGVNILIGTMEKSNVYELIENYKKTHETYVSFHDGFDRSFENMQIDHYLDRTRAFVKIQDGCNNFCSYCVIPYLRKNIRSKDFNTCVEEINNLVSNGFKEIVLTGIHTGSYNSDGHDLTDLIHEISKNEELLRIRISSIEITELDDKFMNEFKNNLKICNHLHIPIQSGSDHVLKMMNRKYTIDEFISKVDMLRKCRYDVNLTTDCLVGFPGETDKDFMELLQTIKKIGFSKVHVFPYSKRDNTVAATLPNQISEEVKKDRARTLINLSDDLELNWRQSFIGKNVEVLLENNYGHTSDYLKVLLDQELEPNKVYTCTVICSENDYVKGKLV